MVRYGRCAGALLVAVCAACAQRPGVATTPAPQRIEATAPRIASYENDPIMSRPATPTAAPAAAPVSAAVAAPSGKPRLPDHPVLSAIGVPDAPRAARLVGKTLPEIEGLFGRAHFIRADKKAEIRQYRNESCVLDVFLYPDAKTTVPRVEHATVRARQGGTSDEGSCLTDFLRAHWIPGA